MNRVEYLPNTLVTLTKLSPSFILTSCPSSSYFFVLSEYSSHKILRTVSGKISPNADKPLMVPK